MEKVNGIILSAGLSSRMLRPKALLPYGRSTFVENLYNTFRPRVDRLVIVVSPELYIRMQQKRINLPEAEFVFNQRPLLGRFYSIYCGVEHLGVCNVFVHNIDTPGISGTTLEVMKASLKPGSYVVPVYKGKSGHPVLLSQEISEDIISRTDYDINFRDVLKKFRRIEVEVDDEYILLNINTPSDLRQLYNRIYNPLIDNNKNRIKI